MWKRDIDGDKELLKPKEEENEETLEDLPAPESLGNKLKSFLRRALTKRNYYYNLDKVYLDLYTSNHQKWRFLQRMNKSSIAKNESAYLDRLQRYEVFGGVENAEAIEKHRRQREKLEKEEKIIRKAVERSKKTLDEYEKNRKPEKKEIWIWQNLITFHL